MQINDYKITESDWIWALEQMEKPTTNKQDVIVGRLQKRIAKLKKQRDHFKERNEFLEEIIKEIPYIEGKIRRLRELQDDRNSIREMKKRIEEQSALIARLLEEQNAKGSNI